MKRRAPPPPVRLAIRLTGVDELVVIELAAAAEPVVVAVIANLARAGNYTGGTARTLAGWTVFDIARPALARLEPRRVRQSIFDRGAVGLAWLRTVSDSDGSLFITRRRESGLDAPYAHLGQAVAGLGALDRLPITAKPLRLGEAPPARVTVENVEVVR
ncbi:MAG TPA: hypothetical protein VGI95_17290 [Caulobacteraceae bacterium]|jgi:cyclophilin family peptidyl-prolyl cis-trans isomerase